MLTRFLTHLHATFSPLSTRRAHRIPRILLSFLPADARDPNGLAIKVTSKILPSSSDEPSRLVVGFRDGKEVIFEEVTRGESSEGASIGTSKEGVLDLGRMKMDDVIQEIDRHSRILKKKSEITAN